MKEKQKAEAIKRMKKLGIFEEAIEQFKNNDVVMRSERGILFWLNEDQKTLVKRFEEEYNALAYMVVHNRTELGDMYSILYISNQENEWYMDWEDLDEPGSEKYIIAAVNNSFGSFDIGSIGVQNRFGGLIRTQ